MITIVEIVATLLAFGLVALFATQIGVPLYRNTPLFPLFRTKEAILLAEQTQALEEVVESELRKDIEEIKSHITHPPKEGEK